MNDHGSLARLTLILCATALPGCSTMAMWKILRFEGGPKPVTEVYRPISKSSIASSLQFQSEEGDRYLVMPLPLDAPASGDSVFRSLKDEGSLFLTPRSNVTQFHQVVSDVRDIEAVKLATNGYELFDAEIITAGGARWAGKLRWEQRRDHEITTSRDVTVYHVPIELVGKKKGYSPWPAVWRIPVTPLTIAADLTVIPGILLLVIFVSG